MARQRWLVAVVAISLGSAACKDKKKEEPKTDPKGAVVPADKGGAAPAKAVDDLGLIPVDSEAVLGINWAQLTASPLWKQFVEPEMLKDNEFVKNMQQFKDRCGFDPMAVVKTMIVGMSKLDAEPPEGVMVLHGPDKAKVLACVDKFADELKKEDVTVTKDGDIVVFQNRDANVAMMFLGNDRVLGTIGSMASVDGIKKAAQGGSTLSTSAAFVDMYGKLNKNDSAWFLANGNSKIFEQASAIGIRPKAVFGSINVTDTMTADVRARLDSPDQATQTATNFRGQVQAMASMFDKLDLTNESADVRLQAAASSVKIKNLFKLVAGGGGM